MTCPHCGAPLPPTNDDFIICEFCDSTVAIGNDSFNIDEPRKFGYEFELGRYDAQDSRPGVSLAAKIKGLLQPVNELNQTNTIIGELESKLGVANNDLNQYIKTGKAKPFVVPFVVMLLIMMITSGEGVAVAWTTGICLFAFLWIKRKINIVTRGKKASQLRSKYQEAVDHLDQLRQKYDFDLIPEEYRHNEPMKYFIKVLDSGRAVSLQHAITLYEDDKHKKEMLKMQQEQLNLQEQQVLLQKKHIQQQQEFNEQQLALAAKKKGVDWGTVAAAAGSVALAVLSIKGRRR